MRLELMSMRARGTVALVLGLIASGASAARAQAVDTTQRGAVPDSSLLTPTVIDAGRKVFHGRGTCHACHGDKLKGGPVAPPLAGPTWRHIDGTFTSIVDRIEKGQPGTVMPARPGGITEEQLFMVAAYVYAVSHGLAKP
jgi:mono/diheme cytochrome c family protein